MKREEKKTGAQSFDFRKKRKARELLLREIRDDLLSVCGSSPSFLLAFSVGRGQEESQERDESLTILSTLLSLQSKHTQEKRIEEQPKQKKKKKPQGRSTAAAAAALNYAVGHSTRRIIIPLVLLPAILPTILFSPSCRPLSLLYCALPRVYIHLKPPPSSPTSPPSTTRLD